MDFVDNCLSPVEKILLPFELKFKKEVRRQKLKELYCIFVSVVMIVLLSEWIFSISLLNYLAANQTFHA